MEESEEGKFYAVRTTIGQEKSVADRLFHKVEKEKERGKADIYSILAPPSWRGYLAVEAINKTEVEKSLYGITHVRGVVEGELKFEEIEQFLEPKSAVAKVDIGDIVELTSGPFKGEKARVVRVDVNKEESTVELFEATVPIPLTVRGDNIRVIRKGGED
ncbi:MAG: transcription elongation factor Spt5 [Candidatus Hydrothermarchaeales archaeon]